MSEVEHLQIASDGVHCLVCKYEIVGLNLGEKCPECGSTVQQFAPSNALYSGLAKVSLILGIISMLTWLAYGVLGLPCGILAVVFAKKARRAVQAGTAPVSSLGMATSGKVCGWVGIVINTIMLAILGVMFLLVYLEIWPNIIMVIFSS